MPKDTVIWRTLTSFFYDLAKEVPIGVLNRVLMNTVVETHDSSRLDVEFCDAELEKWAKKFAEQLIDYRTKFTCTQLHLMGFDKTVSQNGKSVLSS
jgi:hypothetical protein